MSADSVILGTPGGAATPADDLIKDTTTQTFRADVIDASQQVPVLVDFWAPWCGPCSSSPRSSRRRCGRRRASVRLVKMNIDEHPAIAGQLGIQSIPAVIAFKNGQPLDGFMGALPESQVAGLHRAHRRSGRPERHRARHGSRGRFIRRRRRGRGRRPLWPRPAGRNPTTSTRSAGLVRCEVALGNLEQARGPRHGPRRDCAPTTRRSVARLPPWSSPSRPRASASLPTFAAGSKRDPTITRPASTWRWR